MSALRQNCYRHHACIAKNHQILLLKRLRPRVVFHKQVYVYVLTAPDKAPTIISVTPHTTTSVLLRWKVMPLFTIIMEIALITIMSLKDLIKPDALLWSNLQTPTEEHINGILLGFRIRYRELHYDRMRTFTVRTVNNPMASWTELTGESEFNPAG